MLYPFFAYLVQSHLIIMNFPILESTGIFPSSKGGSTYYNYLPVIHTISTNIFFV